MRDIEKDKTLLLESKNDPGAYWGSMELWCTAYHYLLRCEAAQARIKILERRIAAMEREEDEPRSRFRMDANGNLTKIDD